jgi:nucleoside-diphosphate-sugar epimerase
VRIAVLGANGQVGSEVCLLLRKVPGLEVVPVCRNPSGSAFLRWHGLACRHGSVGDPARPRRWWGIATWWRTSRWPSGAPREARERNRRLIEQAALASPAGAKIVYFSTLSVYRRFRPANAPGGRTAYGDEKLRCERDARRVGRRLRKKTYVLRLGHVVGELQAIRQQLSSSWPRARWWCRVGATCRRTSCTR